MNARSALVALAVLLGVVAILVLSDAARLERSFAQAEQATQPAEPDVTPVADTAMPLEPREGIGISWHPFLETKSDADLARDAELIVIGTAGEPSASRWNTPNGELPPGTTARNISERRVTYTDRPFYVDTVLKGAAGESVRVRTLGGTVGQDSVTVESIAPFVVGQQVIVFLKRDDFYTKDYGPEHYTVVGAMQGLFRIVGDRAVRPDRELPLADLLATIEANK